MYVLLRFYLLKTLKCEFINCKQTENKFVFNFSWFLITCNILCATIRTCTTYITTQLQATIVLFTRNFTQGWLLNCYWLASALSCIFIVQHYQSNERSWSGSFLFWPSRPLVYVHSYTCLSVCWDRVGCICLYVFYIACYVFAYV